MFWYLDTKRNKIFFSLGTICGLRFQMCDFDVSGVEVCMGWNFWACRQIWRCGLILVWFVCTFAIHGLARPIKKTGLAHEKNQRNLIWLKFPQSLIFVNILLKFFLEYCIHIYGEIQHYILYVLDYYIFASHRMQNGISTGSVCRKKM